METDAARVRGLVMERIQMSSWPVGGRIPSVRALARELGVSRGTVAYVYQQLIREGILTASPGRGTFVAAAKRPGIEDLKVSVRAHLDQAVRAARLAGYSEVEVLALMRTTVRRTYETERTRIAFVECNPLDATAIANDLRQQISLPVAPVLLDEMRTNTARLQADYDLIATSFNHFAEVQAALPETDVVGLQLMPSTDSLLKIAGLPPDTRIGVVCHYTTTMDLFITTIRAYQSHIVGGALETNEDAVRTLAAECNVLVASLFAHKRVVALVPDRPVLILDLVIAPQSLEYLKSRLLELGYAVPLRPALAEVSSSPWQSRRNRHA